MMGLRAVYLAAAFLIGLVTGSFLNVLIYRLPRGEQTLTGRSMCPECGSPITWYDNIPLFSFALLRGRCRNCCGRISWRYPLVELMTSLLFVAVFIWNKETVTGELFIGLVLVCTLLVASAVDMEFGIIPNRLLLPAAVIELGLVVGTALYRSEPIRIGTAFTGAAAGGGLLLVIGLGYAFFFMRGGTTGQGVSEEGYGVEEEAMGDGNGGEMQEEVPTAIGMGDVKLVAFFGFALGYFIWYDVLVAIFLGVIIGALIAVILMIAGLKGRKDRIRFGPYLSLGALIALFWGQTIVDKYLNLFR